MSDSLPPSIPPSDPLPPAPNPPPGAGISERQWAIILHLSGLLGLVGCSIPGLSIIGPLVIWLLKRPESAVLDAVGKRVLNFQISYAIYLAVSWLGFLVLSAIFIGFLFLPVIGVLFVAWLIFTIIGAIKESNGETFRFPLVIDFLK